MTQVVRVVACDTSYWKSDRAQLAAQEATRREFKHCWLDGTPGAYWASSYLSNFSRLRELCFIQWKGPEEEFLLFRLAENTDLVVAHDVIDLESHAYQQLLTSVETHAQALESYRNVMTGASDKLNAKDTLWRAHRNLTKAFIRLTPNIAGRLRYW